MPASSSLYIGIAAALGAGILEYVFRRSFMWRKKQYHNQERRLGQVDSEVETLESYPDDTPPEQKIGWDYSSQVLNTLTPYTTLAGRRKRWNMFTTGKLLPQKTAVKLVGKQMRDLYG